MLFSPGLVSFAVKIMAEFIFWLATLATEAVEVGKHRAHLIGEGEFLSFWKAIAIVVITIILLVLVSDTAIALIYSILLEYASYSLGATTAVFGSWFIWFVVSNDYDLNTDRKWAVPAICYFVTFLNLALVFYGVVS